ncbi:MAG TPA: hypothetical protein VJ783_32140 [Pirellulales bacterium]|nr:hypothetical protein [Pirellulales bacterium]
MGAFRDVFGEKLEIDGRDYLVCLPDVSSLTNRQDVVEPHQGAPREVDCIAPSDEQLMRYVGECRPPLDYYAE